MAGESKGGGTDWMYNQGQKVDQEDYLLGKKIGKDFENEGTMGQINAVEYDCAPPSIFASKAGHQVDLQRKLMEDPLVAIKKRELEDRKRLLDNPLKMKALKEHIDSLKKQKKDKKKKKKKKKHRGSDSEGSDIDLDLALLQRLEKIEGREAEQDRKQIQEEEEKERKAFPSAPVYTDKEALDSPPREDRRNRNKKDDQDLKRDRPRQRSRSREAYSRRRADSPPRRRRSNSRNHSSPPPSRRRSNSRDMRRSQPTSQKHRSRSREHRRSPPQSYRARRSSRSRSNERRQPSPPPASRRRSRSADRGAVKKLKGEDRDDRKKKNDKKSCDAEKEAEKARKLAEMMDNANWREEQRANKVKAYRKKEEEDSNLAEHDPEFLRRELRKAAANSSVESRIKSNKHNIQRGIGAMDSNFARR